MRSLLGALLMSAFFSASVFAQAPSRGWIDVNAISVRSHQDEQIYTFERVRFGEIETAATAYPEMPTATGIDVGGGVQFHPHIGVGVHLDFANYEYTVGLAVRVPNPFSFNRFGTDEDVTAEALQRKDRGVDIFAMFIAPTPDAWRVRVFGGPSYFSVSQEMVGVINYNQFAPNGLINVVDIAGHQFEEVKGSAWGFNAGADVAFFFSRHVGVGGVVRFSRGTVTLDREPMSGDEADLKAGHTTIGGGLRLRF